jgi:A/G-specific adenine glycosylase
MLQQTQVSRVIPKYEAFLTAFPTLGSLAAASLQEVLRQWQGLGYNRRARFLREASRVISGQGSTFPTTLDELVKLPGIGTNTAAAILVYSFNQPHVFIETNIRTVFLHYFFKDEQDVPDKAILQLVEETLDTANPREFYWALMDYGTHLKQSVGNANVQSRHYKKQSAFAGSPRQLRGKILRELTQGPRDAKALRGLYDDKRFDDVLQGLIRDKLVQSNGQAVSLAM